MVVKSGLVEVESGLGVAIGLGVASIHVVEVTFLEKLVASVLSLTVTSHVLVSESVHLMEVVTVLGVELVIVHAEVVENVLGVAAAVIVHAGVVENVLGVVAVNVASVHAVEAVVNDLCVVVSDLLAVAFDLLVVVKDHGEDWL